MLGGSNLRPKATFTSPKPLSHSMMSSWQGAAPKQQADKGNTRKNQVSARTSRQSATGKLRM